MDLIWIMHNIGRVLLYARINLFVLGWHSLIDFGTNEPFQETRALTFNLMPLPRLARLVTCTGSGTLFVKRPFRRLKLNTLKPCLDRHTVFLEFKGRPVLFLVGRYKAGGKHAPRASSNMM